MTVLPRTASAQATQASQGSQGSQGPQAGRRQTPPPTATLLQQQFVHRADSIRRADSLRRSLALRTAARTATKTPAHPRDTLSEENPANPVAGYEAEGGAANGPPPTPTPAARVPQFETRDAQTYEAEIRDARFRIDEARRERNRYDVEIHKKFSLAAACIIFVFVGAPIALRFPRGGVGLVIGVSFAIFGLYYVGLIGGEALADKALLPPWLAMWAANIVLLAIGLVLSARMGRESATSRGGDFGEMMATFRAKALGWMRSVGFPVERRHA